MCVLFFVSTFFNKSDLFYSIIFSLNRIKLYGNKIQCKSQQYICQYFKSFSAEKLLNCTENVKILTLNFLQSHNRFVAKCIILGIFKYPLIKQRVYFLSVIYIEIHLCLNARVQDNFILRNISRCIRSLNLNFTK